MEEPSRRRPSPRRGRPTPSPGWPDTSIASRPTAGRPGAGRPRRPSDVVSAEGETLVQFRSIDGAGNTSAWTPAAPTGASTVRLDRTGPDRPGRGGRLARVAERRLGRRDRVRVDRLRRLRAGRPTSIAPRPTAARPGRPRAPVRSPTVSAQGETLVQLRAVDGAGNASAWVGATVRIDRTDPSAPSVVGGSSSWQASAPVGRLGIGLDRQRRIGPRAVRVPHQPERRRLVGRDRRRVGERRGRGDDAGAVPKRRRRGQRLGVDARRPDRRQHREARPQRRPPTPRWRAARRSGRASRR